VSRLLAWVEAECDACSAAGSASATWRSARDRRLARLSTRDERLFFASARAYGALVALFWHSP